MEQLPKELTPELLSLVLCTKDKIIICFEILDNELLYREEFSYIEIYEPNNLGIQPNKINIDTLTRLMKEWCYKEDYILSSNHTLIKNLYNCTILSILEGNKFKPLQKEMYKDSSEFEVVVKATHWVAKEKGLL